MVMAQALFKQLKEQDPQASLHILAARHLHPLLERMPEVDRVITLPFAHGELKLRQRMSLGRDLQKEAYTQAIVIPNSFKSALVPFFAKIPKRTGWLGEMRRGILNNARRLDKRLLPTTIARYVALGLPENAPVPSSFPAPRLVPDQNSIRTALHKHGLSEPKRRILSLCPGAEFGPAKRWKTAHFVEVARMMSERGWDIWLFGGPKDQAKAAEIQKQSGDICVNLTGKTSIGDAIDLLSLSTVVLGNDSGLIHISGALNRPLIVTYGSTPPSIAPPLSEQSKILYLGLSCSPCFKRECPLRHHDCMTQIRPADVLQVFDEWGFAT